MSKTRTNKGEDELHTTIKAVVNNKLVSSNEFITLLSDSIMDVITKMYDKEIDVLKKQNDELTKVLRNQEHQIKTLVANQESCDRIRRSRNVIFYGVQESDNENCMDTILGIINNKLNIRLDLMSIDNCFRMKIPDRNNIKPIMTQFSTVSIKQLVYNKKKLLKGTGMVIREDLSPETLKLFKAAVEKIKKNGRLWSNNGNIYVKLNDKDIISKIKKLSDIETM
ncbi:uncharacterized protein [Leptinotarsa decemlineata]|uniref:uncharacterized protein n=1 Tax=Leptinotarsa decemlineata TaxID=7539 RepID=UPI003D309039